MPSMRRSRLAIITPFVFALAVCVTAPATAAGTRLVRAEDLFKLKTIASEQISHDGARVAYVVSSMDGTKNTYLTNIWIADVASGRTWQLTRGDSDGDPAWSPDDKWIAFDSGRDEKSQIYRISLEGGEAQRLTDLPNGASGPSWSHDGSRILFSATSKDKQPPAHIDFSAAGFTPSADQRTSDIRIITRQFWEANGAGPIYNRHRHVWLMAADGSGVKQLTSGEWSERGAVWSPDDRTIAYNSFRGEDPYGLRDDIYVLSSDGGAPRRIPLALVGNDGPTWAHDGQGLYYFKTINHDPAAYPALAYTAVDGSAQREILPVDTVAFGDAILTDMDEGGAGCGPLFDPHDRWYLAIASKPGATALVKYDARTGALQTIAGGDREILECSMSDDGNRTAFVASDATHPGELYVADTTGGQAKRLTDINAAYLASVDLSVPQPLRVRDPAGFDVQAWVMRPPHAVAGRRYPLVLDIHGGPQTEFGNAFFHEFQYLAALGYVVVYADPRGSVGFGHAFEAALNDDWGDAMFQDEMAVLDAAVRNPDVDPNRLGVSGGSYGGYASLWLISHTDRFKVAIAERVASDLLSQWLSGDANVAWDTKYSQGNAWDHFDRNWRQSPQAYVASIHTPLMLLHSDGDIRTPPGQTLEIYSALKILGRTVEFVDVPRDDHDLSRTGEPIHRVERLHISADWLAKYLHP